VSDRDVIIFGLFLANETKNSCIKVHIRCQWHKDALEKLVGKEQKVSQHDVETSPTSPALP